LATVVLERELKLQADAAFAMPDLSAIPGVTASVGPAQQLVAVYYDTPSLALAQWGVTLRRRDDGWTLKVPVGDGHHVLSRHEVTFPGAGASPH
jgi:inorganic triphosphatase YgiF